MLTASELTRLFEGRAAVDRVSFEVARGEIFALLGPNGAGKTTTLRMLAGLIVPSSGTVRVDTEALSRRNGPRLRARIGFLTETPGLWDRLTVRQNLVIYARMHGLANPQQTVADVLNTLEIRDRSEQPAAHLSKGLKQRVAIARTLLHRPDIVLLDEPTAGLDPESARDVRDLVLRLKSENRSVVISTHNLDEVERIATRVAIMRTGLLAVDTPARLRERLFGVRVCAVLAQPAARFLDVLAREGFADVRADGAALSIGVRDQGSDTSKIVRRLVECGADIQSVTPEAPPLEQVYLRLIGQVGSHGPDPATGGVRE